MRTGILAHPEALGIVAAEGIDPDRRECFRIPAVVHGPGDDLDPGIVRPTHEVRVDEVPFLPEGLCTGGQDGSDRVERIRCREHSSSEAGVAPAEPGDDPMVEAVDRAAAWARSGGENGQEVGVGLGRERLDLDPDLQVSQGCEGLFEQWNGPRSGAGHLCYLPPTERGDGAKPGDNGVVVDHQLAVCGRVDVQLHTVGAKRQGRSKCVEGILRGVSGGAPVGERSRNHDGRAISLVDRFAISR